VRNSKFFHKSRVSHFKLSSKFYQRLSWTDQKKTNSVRSTPPNKSFLKRNTHSCIFIFNVSLFVKTKKLFKVTLICVLICMMKGLTIIFVLILRHLLIIIVDVLLMGQSKNDEVNQTEFK